MLGVGEGDWRDENEAKRKKLEMNREGEIIMAMG